MTISRNVSILAQGASSSGVLNASYGGSLTWQSVQTGNFAAAAGNAYPVDTTSGAVTVTLPASPTAGNIIQLTDYNGKWAQNNVTVNPNGNKIAGSTSNAVLSIGRESAIFVYIDSTQGWIISSGVNVAGLGQTYSASYLIVGGGGGGANGTGGGGGAGGFQTGSVTLTVGVTYSATVGSGGSGGGNSTRGASGGNSFLSVFPATNGIASLGGGGGGTGAVAAGQNTGAPGSSGGGGGGNTTASAGGAATAGQGFSGGTGSATGTVFGAGGGGGASAVGANGSSTVSGNGGAGLASSITGSSVTYAGGGGGGTYNGGTVGTGGSGGGGAGSSGAAAGVPPAATAGTANTGGGGGGTGGNTTSGVSGANGGSGVIILSVPTTNYTGIISGSPTVTTSGSNTILKFTASGSYTA